MKNAFVSGGHSSPLDPARGRVTNLMIALALRAVTHRRPVWEPSGAQHSSRWLNRGRLALLFASASFVRLDLDAPSPVRIPARRASVIPLGRAVFLCCEGTLSRVSGSTAGADPPRLHGWRSLHRDRSVLSRPMSLPGHRRIGSSRSAATPRCIPALFPGEGLPRVV